LPGCAGVRRPCGVLAIRRRSGGSDSNATALPSLSQRDFVVSPVTDEPIRVLIVDDHSVVRRGLRMFLSPEVGFEVVGEAADGQEAIEQARALHPKIVLMDLLLPGMSGIEATAAIRAELPDVEVVVLTSVLDDVAILHAVRAGAVGYLLKEASGDELRGALRAARAGQVQLSSEVANRLVEGLLLPTSSNGLTDREIDVLGKLTEGKANKEIARELQLSQETIKTYVKRILGKLGVQTRTQAAVYALTRGLLRRP
jgi:two-component system, NarL family, response regulator LiaR